MKKIFTLFIVIVLFFTISGCSEETEKAYSETETVNSTIQSTEPSSLTYDSVEYWKILSIVLRKFIFKLNRLGYHEPVRLGSVKSAVHEACS